MGRPILGARRRRAPRLPDETAKLGSRRVLQQSEARFESRERRGCGGGPLHREL